MGHLSSINFKKSKNFQVFHNATIRPSYIIGGKLECNRKGYAAKELKERIIAKAQEAYVRTIKQPFKAKSYEWSAVVNLKPDSTMDDLERLAEHFDQKYGFQCYQIAIHRDEGHIDDDGIKQINHHAHLEFITLDKETGKNNYRRELISPKILRQIQTETAEILGMERGMDKRISGVKRIEPRKYAQMKEAERKRAKEREAELEIQIKAADDVITHTIADKDTQINDLSNKNQKLTDDLDNANQIQQSLRDETNKLITAIKELKKELEKETAERKQWKSWNAERCDDLRAICDKIGADRSKAEYANELKPLIDAKLSDLSNKRSKTAQRLAKTRKVAQNARNELKITKKQIAERIEAERKKWIAEQGHTKEDYAALSVLKRECLAMFEKQGVKSMAELNDKIAALNAEISVKDTEIFTKNLDLIELGVLKNEKIQLTQKITELSNALEAAQNTQSNNDDSENTTYKNHHRT